MAVPRNIAGGMTTRQKISWGVGTIATVATIGSIWYWIQKDKREEEEKLSEDQKVFYPPNLTKGSNIGFAEALRRANNIQTAIKGAGTDEKAVFRAQYKLNADALRYLYNTFGIRNGENMGQWIIGDFEGDDLAAIRGQWLLRGVTPPF